MSNLAMTAPSFTSKAMHYSEEDGDINPSCKSEIVIEVMGGVVTDVHGLPEGMFYRVVDHDV